MFHFLRTGKMKVIAVIVTFAMIFTLVQPGTVVNANETGSIDSTISTKTLKADEITSATYNSSFEISGFTITAAANGKEVSVEDSYKIADDGESFLKCIKLGGKGTIDYRSIKFTTTAAASVKIYAMSNSYWERRTVDVYKADGTKVGSVTAYRGNLRAGTVELTQAGDYYLASPKDGINVYCVKVTTGSTSTEPKRPDWNNVAAPSITKVVQNGQKLVVTFELLTGYNGADKATVQMFDQSRNLLSTVVLGMDPSTTRTAEFTPTANGKYTFKVIAERNGESVVKESSLYVDAEFFKGLAAPTNVNAVSLDNQTVKVSWDPVRDAEGYVISYRAEGGYDSQTYSTRETSMTFGSLTRGVKYIFMVKAVRGSELSSAAQASVTLKNNYGRQWYFSAFGQGVNTTDNYYSGNANDGSVTVASERGKGRLSSDSTDGLAFYYTAIDPQRENFTLSATVTVNSWTLYNGQEGFGLMACDAVGANGDSRGFWNNSYMNSVSKVEYYWDKDNHRVSYFGDKMTMQLGVGAQEKIGVTASNSSQQFKSTMSTLETSCAGRGAGTYNIVGNYQNQYAPSGTVDNITTFRMKIQRDNTGYRLSYTDKNGNTTTKLFYDKSRSALTQIDRNNIYVGFFAAGNAKITVSDISLTTTNPANDPPAEEERVTYVTPSYNVVSPTETNSSNYEMSFLANADGRITIRDKNNYLLVDRASVRANTYYKNLLYLAEGSNRYRIEFTPDPNYKPGFNQLLSSYNTVAFDFYVTLRNKSFSQNVLYVSPNGSSQGDGTRAYPLDIYTAISSVRQNQKIVLLGGNYNLNRTVTIERGNDGASNQLIYMVGDPYNAARPVLNFGKSCAGMVVAGDYWYLKGFDITQSADKQKGLQLAGSHCVLDGIYTYNNGNTGITLSRYKDSDPYTEWPAYNVILNCTSYGNADWGYTEADGFSARQTVGNGNAFEGCIAYNNADDGFEVYSKPDTGAIGSIVIQNSIAYSNGYLSDGRSAGNGSGFKLGGSSLSGYHKLSNCVAFNNKGKGIDSNNCPDIQVYDSTSFNNGSYNIAFYSNDASNTDYYADGIISFRTTNTTIGDYIRGKGSQSSYKIYGRTNYYWDGNLRSSYNTENRMVAENWFSSIDTRIGIYRKPNGTININSLFVLTAVAPVDAGARIEGVASNTVYIPEEYSYYPTPYPTSTPIPWPTATPTPTPSLTPTPKPLIDSWDIGNITVNGVGEGDTSKLLLYSGGTTGKTQSLKVKIPDTIQNVINGRLVKYKLNFKSSKTNVASVSDSGKITAKSPGTSTITTRLVIGDYILYFYTKVTVKEAYVEFTKTSKIIDVGKKVTFKIAVYGYDKDDIYWVTTKAGIATVGKNYGSSTAVVAGESAGTDYLYIKVYIKGKTYVCAKVKVAVVKQRK